MLQIGDVIKNLRIKNNYTQNDLAIMLGLQLSTLQKYESGSIVNLKLETLRELCEIFEVPPIVFVFPNIDDKTKLELLKWSIKEYSGLNDIGIKKAITHIDDLRKIHEYNIK